MTRSAGNKKCSQCKIHSIDEFGPHPNFCANCYEMRKEGGAYDPNFQEEYTGGHKTNAPDKPQKSNRRNKKRKKAKLTEAENHGEVEENHIEERCKFCDSQNKINPNNNTFRCSICNYPSSRYSWPKIDFDLNDKPGPRGGKPKILIEFNKFTKKWKRLIPEQRQDEILREINTSDEYEEYYSRWLSHMRRGKYKYTPKYLKALKEEEEKKEAEEKKKEAEEKKKEAEERKKEAEDEKIRVAEKNKIRVSEEKKLREAIESSNFIILLPYHSSEKDEDLVKEIYDVLLSELKRMRTVKSENFREILEKICSKPAWGITTELLPELFLTLFINYPELLTNADKGFDHWVKYERENVLTAINNIPNKEFEIIKSMVDKKTIRTLIYRKWFCYGKKQHKYTREIGLYLEGAWPEECPSCGAVGEMDAYEKMEYSWSKYTLKEFDSLLNQRK